MSAQTSSCANVRLYRCQRSRLPITVPGRAPRNPAAVRGWVPPSNNTFMRICRMAVLLPGREIEPLVPLVLHIPRSVTPPCHARLLTSKLQYLARRCNAAHGGRLCFTGSIPAIRAPHFVLEPHPGLALLLVPILVTTSVKSGRYFPLESGSWLIGQRLRCNTVYFPY